MNHHLNSRIGEETKKQSMQQQVPAGVSKKLQPKGNASSSDNPFTMQIEIAPGTRASATDRREIIESFRRVLASRGVRGIVGLAHQLRIADFEKSGEIDLNDFIQVIQGFKVPISNADIRSLFETFDNTKKGKINYMNFITIIRGEMNTHRRAIAELAFKYIDRDNQRIISIKDLLGGFCAKNHPLVRTGKRTEEQILTEFIETFEMNKSLFQGSEEIIVTKEEFMSYYDCVSASVDSNKEFEDLVMSTWRLYNEEAKTVEAFPKKKVTVSQSAPFGTSEEPTDYSTALRPKKEQLPQAMQPAGTRTTSVKDQSKLSTLRPGERQLVNHFKELLLSKRLKGILSFQMNLRSIDKDYSGHISFPEFIKVLKDHRLKYDEADAEKLFKVFDKDHSGEINYEELLNTTIVIPLIIIGRNE